MALEFDHLGPGDYDRAKRVLNRARHPGFVGRELFFRCATTGSAVVARDGSDDLGVSLIAKQKLQALSVVREAQGRGIGAALVVHAAPKWVNAIMERVPWFEKRGYRSVGAPKIGQSGKMATQLMELAGETPIEARLAELPSAPRNPPPPQDPPTVLAPETPIEARLAELLALLPDETEIISPWRQTARPEQLMPGSPNAVNSRADWRTWLLMAGRGFGKTRTGAETVVELVDAGRARAIALIAPTYKAVRRLMIEHPVSGIIARSTPGNVPSWNKSDGELRWPNGAIAYVYTAEEPDGPRGFNGDLAWCEEIGSWQYPNETWANLQLGLRIPGPLGDRARAIVTTTPRPISLLRDLVANPSTVITGGKTFDNAANLDPEALKEFVRLFGGTRLGLQELDAILLGDTPGALWTLAMLDANRIHPAQSNHELRYPPENFLRVVVGVDPAVKDTTSAAADEDLAAQKGAETGIVVCAIAQCRCRCKHPWEPPEIHGFVLEDATDVYSPKEWAEKIAEMYAKHHADRVIAEINQGGALVESNIRTLGGNRLIPYRGVSASKGKQPRAEPIASLDEKGMIHHLGTFAKLEDQMCTWQPLRSKKSPDRMDARVWGFTELMLEGAVGSPRARTGGKARA